MLTYYDQKFAKGTHTSIFTPFSTSSLNVVVSSSKMSWYTMSRVFRSLSRKESLTAVPSLGGRADGRREDVVNGPVPTLLFSQAEVVFSLLLPFSVFFFSIAGRIMASRASFRSSSRVGRPPPRAGRPPTRAGRPPPRAGRTESGAGRTGSGMGRLVAVLLFASIVCFSADPNFKQKMFY